MQDFDPFDHFGFLTHRVSRLMDLMAQPYLKEKGYDFPVSCISILADLWSKDGVTQKELGSSTIKTKSSITKMLDSLLKHGLIVKKDDPLDRRNKLIYLTVKGRDFRVMLDQMITQHQKDMTLHHTSEEIQNAKNVLKTIYLNLKEKVKTQDQK